MTWLRRGFVHFLAFLLLLALLCTAASYSFNHNFSGPTKLEGWLSDSGIYNHIISQAVSNAQKNSQDSNESSVSLSDPGVSQVANQSISPEELQQYVNTFLDANFAWLKGKTPTPQFAIDISKSKQDLSNNIGQLVQKHLSGLPVCTTAQLAQLQFPVDPLTVNCRPPTLDAKTEGQQVAQSINSGDFLSKPVITPATLSKNHKPYYQKLSALPKLYRLSLKLPLILMVLSLLLILGIVTIAPTRHKGWRRVGSVLLTAGIILVLITFLADWAVKKVEAHAFTQTLTGQLQQPYHNLLSKIESSLVNSDLWFGIGYIVLAILIFVGLIMIKRRGGQPARRPVAAPSLTDQVEENQPTPSPAASDINSPASRPSPTPINRPTAPTLRPAQPRRKPPKLIQ